jgi:small subunit ribosomal protein S11
MLQNKKEISFYMSNTSHTSNTSNMSKKPKYLKKLDHKGIIHIQSTRNNTILTLTDLQGNSKCWTSAGSIGFRNTRKSTTYAAQAAAERLASKALNLGFNVVVVKIKGLGYGKDSSVRALYKSQLYITKIIERTPIPHNGCRAPKKRRM